MYPIVAIRQALICIYRLGLIFCFILALGCDDGSSSDKRKETTQSGQQNPSDKQALLAERNTTQRHNKRKRADEQSLDAVDDVEASMQKVKWVAKVPENKQVIVLLHGLHRLSLDFEKMKGYLKDAFKDATILALTSVNKDPNKKGSFAPSPTVEYSIKEQARLAYDEMLKDVPRGSHVVIVGHSQGGLRGFTLAKEYGSRFKNEYGITIEGLITIGTPWKGARVMDYIDDVNSFKQKFDEIEAILDMIQTNYSKAVRGYFFKFMPGLARVWPWLYEKLVPIVMENKYYGVANLRTKSDFITEYIASNLEKIDLPITAIAGVLTNFSKLFDPFPSSIRKEALEKLNAIYAELIGGDPKCEHDMLLSCNTQLAKGLKTKNFKRIIVEGACHGNKVGIAVKPGLSEINNDAVIQEVVKSIKETFYEQKEEEVVDKKEKIASAA